MLPEYVMYLRCDLKCCFHVVAAKMSRLTSLFIATISVVCVILVHANKLDRSPEDIMSKPSGTFHYLLVYM